MSFQPDLFGELQPQQKSFSEIYNEYISSRNWKIKRKQALERAGYECQVCGVSRWSAKLEVHHKNYDRFGHEDIADLLVVCPKCHEAQDKQYKDALRNKQIYALENARFEGFADKVLGEEWFYDEDYAIQLYEDWVLDTWDIE